MRKNIKEYLYLDTTEVNSILAQYDEGLNTLTRRINQHLEGAGTASSESESNQATLSGGIPGLAKGEGGFNSNKTDSTSQNASDMTQDAKETVYNDYGVDILEEYLSDSLNKSNQHELGSYIKIKDNFSAYDFSSLSRIINPEKISHLMNYSDDNLSEEEYKNIKNKIRLLNKQKSQMGKDGRAELQKYNELIAAYDKKQKSNKASTKVFQTIHDFSEFASTSLENSILLKTSNSVIYAETNNFRMNSSQLQMLQNNPRKITILGVVENVITNADEIRNGFEQSNFESSDIGRIASIMSSIMLVNFGIVEEGYLQIKPLAIYFDNE